MHILIENNKFFKENLNYIKKNGLTPILIFKIKFDKSTKLNEKIKEFQCLQKANNLKNSAILVEIEKIDNKITNYINTLKQNFDIIIGQGGLNKVNKFFIEQTKIDFLLDPQNSKFKPKMDFIHHFNCGLNHILFKYAKNRNIKLMFNLNNFGERQMVFETGRVNQNLSLARKFDVEVIFCHFLKKPSKIKTFHEIKGMLSFYKISEKQINNSKTLLKKIIILNKEINNPNFICNGISKHELITN